MSRECTPLAESEKNGQHVIVKSLEFQDVQAKNTRIMMFYVFALCVWSQNVKMIKLK